MLRHRAGGRSGLLLLHAFFPVLALKEGDKPSAGSETERRTRRCTSLHGKATGKRTMTFCSSSPADPEKAQLETAVWKRLSGLSFAAWDCGETRRRGERLSVRLGVGRPGMAVLQASRGGVEPGPSRGAPAVPFSGGKFWAAGPAARAPERPSPLPSALGGVGGRRKTVRNLRRAPPGNPNQAADATHLDKVRFQELGGRWALLRVLFQALANELKRQKETERRDGG